MVDFMSKRTERIKKQNEDYRNRNKSFNKIIILIFLVAAVIILGLYKVSTTKPDAHVDDWNLIVVNDNTKLPKKFKVTLANFDGLRVDRRIKQNITDLLNDAEEEGINIGVRSSYRSIKNQEYLYNTRKDLYKEKHPNGKNIEEVLTKYISKPGYSEYHTGLLVNFIASDDGSSFNTDDKRKLEKWLSNNAYKYGFIKRYPKGKSKITGKYGNNTIYRYVGEDNAKYINKKDLCLEEYVNSLK